MKIIQVVPRRNVRKSLSAALNETERGLRGRGTTFIREKTGKWKHTNYNGWINWCQANGGVLVDEIKSRAPDSEWQLLQAFIGYLDRHLSKLIESISISYR
jgi:hypothetical protein